MMFKLALYLLIALFSTTCIGKTIFVDYGEIKIVGYDNCTITCNGHTFTVDKPGTASGLWFGLINYNCDNDTGSLISEMKCKDCGLLCNYNELIQACQQNSGLLLLGTIIGVVLSLIIIVTLNKRIFIMVDNLWERAILWSQLSSDNKRINQVKKIYKSTGQMPTVHFAKKTNVSIKNMEDLKKSRANKIKKIEEYKVKTIANEPIYITPTPQPNIYPSAPLTTESYIDTTGKRHNIISEVKGSNTVAPGLSKNRIPKPRAPAIPTKPIVPPKPAPNEVKAKTYKLTPAEMLVTGLALTTPFIDTSNACDMNLYLTSSGKICNANVCKDINMYSFPLRSGESICFKDYQNNDFRIKMTNSYYRYRYHKVYYTSDFEIKEQHYSVCKESGDECWNGYCKADTVGNQIEGLHGEYINRYGCGSDTIGCDRWCFYGTSCVFYQWWLVRNGSLATIYKRSSYIWELELEISYRDTTKKAVINVNNPSFKLNDFSLDDITEIPMYVTSFNSEQYYKSTNILMHNGAYALVEASELNMPELDKIGDYQLSLDKKTEVYSDHGVKCQVNSCTVVCQYPEPKLRRLLRTVNPPKTNDILRKPFADDRVWEIKSPVNSMINLMLGNVEFKNLLVIPPSCKISPDMTYGCTGCAEQSYIIFRASGIQVEGIVPFESNCTFSRDYLSCNSEPYKLELLSTDKVCQFYIPSFNSSFIVNIDYEFLGKLDPSLTISTLESTGELAKTVFKSPSFWTGIISSLSLFTTISISGSIILKLVRIYAVNKGSKNIETV